MDWLTREELPPPPPGGWHRGVMYIKRLWNWRRIRRVIFPFSLMDLTYLDASIYSQSLLLYYSIYGAAALLSLSALYSFILLCFLSAWNELYILEHIGECTLVYVLLSWLFGIALYVSEKMLVIHDTYIYIGFSFVHLFLAYAGLRYALHLFKKHVSCKAPLQRDLSGKVYIVTGANAGVGYETTKSIASMGGTVIMAVRTRSKGEAAKRRLEKHKDISPTKLILLDLDLNSFENVQEFVNSFLKLKLPLHVLINNAGVMMSNREVSQDNLEMVIQANHLSHFLLTNLLIPHMRDTIEADLLTLTRQHESKKKESLNNLRDSELIKHYGRIIHVSSALHKFVHKYDFGDFLCEKNYSLFSTYSQSKLANLLFCEELQRRLDIRKCPIITTTVHPGLVMTEVTKNMNWFLRYGDMLATPIMMLLRKTPPQGAYTSVYVASTNDIDESFKGAYFSNCQKAPKGPASSDNQGNEDDGAKLWQVSEKYVGREFLQRITEQ